MTSVNDTPTRPKVTVGVDTHKHLHAAVALDELGARLGELVIPADTAGYTHLASWAREIGEVLAFGVETTGSYGAGLASLLRRHGHTVIEVNRPDRRDRRQRGKTDLLDAENAARAVLAGRANAIPKLADGTVEMLRQLKIAKDTAVKARTQAMVTLKTLIVTAPTDLREQLDGLSKMALIRTCAALRPGALTTVLGSSQTRAARAGPPVAGPARGSHRP